MNDQTRLLVEILALTDAVWVPNRDWYGRRGSVVYEARQDYIAAGVNYSPAATDADGRRTAQRNLDDLAAAGLVDISLGKGAKRAGVRLKDAGEAKARALVGLPSLRKSLKCLADLVKAQAGPEAAIAGDTVWIPEVLLAGMSLDWKGCETAKARKPLVDLEDLLLPCLVRQYVESNSDMTRHVYYRATAAGAEALERGQPESPRTAKDPEASSLYLERIREHLARLDSTEPHETREIGLLPLPCSMLRRKHVQQV